MRISDWSSAGCSSDLVRRSTTAGSRGYGPPGPAAEEGAVAQRRTGHIAVTVDAGSGPAGGVETGDRHTSQRDDLPVDAGPKPTEGEPGEAAARCLAGPPGRREAEIGRAHV